MYLHSGSPEGVEFITNLNYRDDMMPFAFDSTFILVNYHWRKVRVKFIKWLVIPYLICLIAVFLENNFFFKSDKKNGDFAFANYIIDKLLAGIILLYAL
jgi:hypothetical protein